MSFLRTLLMFVFLVSLISVSGSEEREKIVSKSKLLLEGLKSYDNDILCFHATATSDGKKIWNTKSKQLVKEAQKRGLNCQVKEINNTINAPIAIVSDPPIKSRKDTVKKSLSVVPLNNYKSPLDCLIE